MTQTTVWPTKTRELHNHHLDSTIWNDLEFRDDDIVISTYAKSGTTWMQQIVAQMPFGPNPELEVAEMSPWLDLRIPEGSEAADGGGADAPTVPEDAPPPQRPRLLVQGEIYLHAILEGARQGGVIGVVDPDAASRMFAGALLTYAILDGLLVGGGPPPPPAPEETEAVVELFMKAIS